MLQALFSYIQLIKQASTEGWRYQEKAQLDALALEYEENIKPLNLITEYAQHQFVFSPKELNKLRATIGSFDHSVILNALSHLKPANLRLKVISKDVPADKTCAFYEAKYSVEDIPLEVIASLNSPSLIDELELPPPNPYLGNEYQLVLPESGFHIPNKLIDKQGYQFWFAQDQQFHSPKGDILSLIHI